VSSKLFGVDGKEENEHSANISHRIVKREENEERRDSSAEEGRLTQETVSVVEGGTRMMNNTEDEV
jgi:hypothetical protein